MRCKKKKLSHSCDSRSYCMQQYDRLKLLRDIYFNANPTVYLLWSQRLDLWIKMLIQELLWEQNQVQIEPGVR